MPSEKQYAQRDVDRLDMEIQELYKEIRKKERARDKADRIANPSDYENLCAGGIPNCSGGATCTSDHK